MALISTGNNVPLLQAVVNRLEPVAVGDLPAAADNLGQVYTVNDALAPAAGAAVAAGGAAKALVWSNGAAWNVIGV